MRLLLDTHIALWAITDHPKLSDVARHHILNENNTISVSVVSLWEIAIKHSLGRGEMPVDAKSAYEQFMASGYQILSIQAEHTLAVSHLPLHHQDPFDRLLIAQSIAEPMILMTRDHHILKYGETILGV